MRLGRVVFGLLAGLGLALAPVPLVAQVPAGSAMDSRSFVTPWNAELRETLSTPGGAFASSLVVPGAGQAALGARRWILYAALEVGLWAVRMEAVGDRRTAARGYRDLAWDVARFAGEAPRRDGSWGYYETMSQYLRSGEFDRDPAAPGVQPELDPESYNGTVWALARAIFLPGGAGSPGTAEYDRALEYYDERAAGPDFLWSWEGEEASLERFRALIGRADDAARTARGALGAVLANHLVSAVDALVLARLHAAAGARLESRIIDSAPLQWELALRLPIR